MKMVEKSKSQEAINIEGKNQRIEKKSKIRNQDVAPTTTVAKIYDVQQSNDGGYKPRWRQRLAALEKSDRTVKAGRKRVPHRRSATGPPKSATKPHRRQP